MSDPLLFIRESRHIFDVCPICGVVHRLNDLQIARKGRYPPDWFDKIEERHDRLVMRLTALESRKKEYQQAAIEQAEAVELPKLLQKVAPTFIKWKTNPRDVRTIFNPVEFLIFDGLSSGEGVRSVSLVHVGERTGVIRAIEKAIEQKEFGWKTLHVDDYGTVSEKHVRSKESSPLFSIEKFHLD